MQEQKQPVNYYSGKINNANKTGYKLLVKKKRNEQTRDTKPSLYEYVESRGRAEQKPHPRNSNYQLSLSNFDAKSVVDGELQLAETHR